MQARHNASLAAGKAIAMLSSAEQVGRLGLETSSVYGQAVAMPQIARSTDWSGTLTSLAIRSYFFLIINVVVQGFFLAMIGKEQLVMYPFAGQMHLCDFGADIDRCPGGPNCQGPGGTTYSRPRLYSFKYWSTRVFIRDSLKALFPHKADEIDIAGDPGEYGLENYYCRMACCFIFMMSVVQDFKETVGLARVLWMVPTKAEAWISFDEPEWAKKHEAKVIHGWSELDLVKYKVAGMPLHWKVANFFFVLLPKVCIWFSLAKNGTHFLMESSEIVNTIVNAMALTFVLEVDEIMFDRLTTQVTKHMMGQLEDLEVEDNTVEGLDDQEVLERFKMQELSTASRLRKISGMLPTNLLFILCMQALFTMIYYVDNCDLQEDGSLVSKAVYLPKIPLKLNYIALMFGFAAEEQSEPSWTMPD